MKLKLLSIFTLGLPLLAFSQVSLNSSMAPAVGSKIVYYDANVPSPAFTFSKSGTSNTWDFSSIAAVPGADDTTYIVSPSSISGGSAFPTATHCIYDDGASPSYTMLKVNSTGVTYLGAVADPVGTGSYVPLALVPPLQVLTFPYTYGSSGGGTAYISLTLSGAAVGQPTLDSVRSKSTVVGQRNVIASGNMILPSGTLAAILERSIDTQIDSIFGKSALTNNQWVFLNRSTSTDSAFYWYTNQSLEPYAHALYDNTGLHDVNYYRETLVTGLDETKAMPTAGNVYPNPVNNILYFNLPAVSKGDYELKMLNAEGQLVMKGNTTMNQMDVSRLVPGVYILQLTDADGNMSSTKFIKN